MRLLIASLIAFVLSVIPLAAQEVQPPDREIEAVISNQLAAFTEDDVDTAFSFAAPTIQDLFGTPQNFGLMVERGYPMIWRPDDVRFGDLIERDGGLYQRVMIRDGKGASHTVEYEMLDMGGQWRIGGVQILPQVGVAA